MCIFLLLAIEKAIGSAMLNADFCTGEASLDLNRLVKIYIGEASLDLKRLLQV